MAALTTAPIAPIADAYTRLAENAPGRERHWWQPSHAVTFTALGTALRRGELLGLRWNDIELLHGRLQVRKAFVRGSPKKEWRYLPKAKKAS